MFAVREVSCVQYVTLKNPLVVFADEVCDLQLFTGICEIQLSREIDLQFLQEFVRSSLAVQRDLQFLQDSGFSFIYCSIIKRDISSLIITS